MPQALPPNSTVYQRVRAASAAELGNIPWVQALDAGYRAWVAGVIRVAPAQPG